MTQAKYDELRNRSYDIEANAMSKSHKNPKSAVNWHWDEPSWPLARFRSEKAEYVAGRLTVYRCFWCRKDFRAEDAESFMEQHTAEHHFGKPVQYTAYPPTMSLDVRGGDV